MEKTYSYTQDVHHQLNKGVVEEYSMFDEVMEKITNHMFKVILFGGIPFFLWIVVQAFLKF